MAIQNQMVTLKRIELLFTPWKSAVLTIIRQGHLLAGATRIELILQESKSCVLPLDDTPIQRAKPPKSLKEYIYKGIIQKISYVLFWEWN